MLKVFRSASAGPQGRSVMARATPLPASPARVLPALRRDARPAPVDLLARARLLGHDVQRFTPVAASLSPVSPGALQRAFDLDQARTFVVTNPPAWPDKKPKNLMTSYRSMRGIATALTRDPNWDQHDETTVANLLTALTESWDAKAAEAERIRREAAKLKDESDGRKRVTAELKKHVLKGDFEGSSETPTGFHSTIGESTTHEAYGTSTDLGNGVYQRSVKGKRNTKWVKKGIQSTFFPDTVGDRAATEDDVVVALGTALGSSTKQVKYPAEWNALTLVKKGKTIFPSGGSDTLASEDLT